MKYSDKFNLDYRPETYWLEDESLTYHDELGALIATVTYHSVFGEMIGIYAQKVGDKIKYSARDIYAPQFDTASDYNVFPTESFEPLSLAQIIELIDSVYREGGNYRDQPGLVFPILNLNHEQGEVSREFLDYFVHVESDFYPDLCRWYVDAINRWITKDDAFSSIDEKPVPRKRLKATPAKPDSPIFRRGLTISPIPGFKKSKNIEAEEVSKDDGQEDDTH